MRRLRPSFVPRSSRLLAAAGACAVSLCAANASAAQPAAAAPAPAPATTTTEVAAAPGDSVVVVSTTTTPAPTAAPIPVLPPTPAAAPAATSIVVNCGDAAPATAPSAGCPVAEPVDPLEQARKAKRSEKNRALGLAAAGWSVWGSTYLLSALIGTIAIDTAGDSRMRRFGTWMTVPVAGPFAAAFNARSATGTLFITTLGVAQAAGFTMAVIGTARHRRAKRDLRLMAMPTRTGGHIGLSMRF